MPLVKNGCLLFNEIPTGYPEPGKTTIYDETRTIDLQTIPLNGGVLLKTLVLSIDPYMRGRMREPHIKSYAPPYIKGEPLNNLGIGVVLRSEYSNIKPGDHVYGMLPFQEYTVFEDASNLQVLNNDINLPWTVYIGTAGMPGQTAYCGWEKYAHPEKGDVVFVTAGAGAVGALVVQLAKSGGLKVIASAGSEEKVEFLKAIGADVAFNYKTTKTEDVLKKEGPINIYWDNVGGESLDVALANAAIGARFIICGMISGYNGAKFPITNLAVTFEREITISGFLVGSLLPKYKEEFYREIPRHIANGEIKYREDVTKGLENAGQAILDVQSGKNRGKSVVVVADA